LAALAVAMTPTVVFAQCFQVNFAPLGAKLNEDTTEAQVVGALGYTPTAVSLDTCGQKSDSGPWQCKIEMFGGDCSGSLRVYFRKTKDGVWVVNNWDATQPTGL
jgi:hypothetical protein